MNDSRLRRQIAWEAARLLLHGRQLDCIAAKIQAGRRLSSGAIDPESMPTNAEVREQFQLLARSWRDAQPEEPLRLRRQQALRVMQALWRFRPRLVEDLATEQDPAEGPLVIEVFANSLEAVQAVLHEERCRHRVESPAAADAEAKAALALLFVPGETPLEIAVFPAKLAFRKSTSPGNDGAGEGLGIRQLQQLLANEPAAADFFETPATPATAVDRFLVYHSLLAPLENVRQSVKTHPEGDALYHSLQVFELARNEVPYDEEFLLAALLHDVGKGIDAQDHVAAGLAALDGHITERTGWLIENHGLAQSVLDGTIGARARRRLTQAEDYDELMLLARCDRAGRRQGAAAPELDEALDYLRELAQACGE